MLRPGPMDLIITWGCCCQVVVMLSHQSCTLVCLYLTMSFTQTLKLPQSQTNVPAIMAVQELVLGQLLHVNCTQTQALSC